MATKNRRVATYLPEHLEEAFNKFKVEHRLGDSQAILAILSNYLGVSQEVAYSSDSPKFEQRLSGLEDKLLSLKGELLGELLTELSNWRQDIDSRLLNLEGSLLSQPLIESSIDDVVPGQLAFFNEDGQVQIEPVKEVSEAESAATQLQNDDAQSVLPISTQRPGRQNGTSKKKKVDPDPIPEEVQCPACGSFSISKYGSYPNGQRKYVCKKCKKQFRSPESSAIKSTPKPRRGRSVSGEG